VSGGVELIDVGGGAQGGGGPAAPLPPAPNLAEAATLGTPLTGARRASRVSLGAAGRQSRARVGDSASGEPSGAEDEAQARGVRMHASARAALAHLGPLIDEASHAGGCWREAFPAGRVRGVAAALSAMLDDLDLLHETLAALQPGGVGLVAPLLKPINRVEAEVVHALRALLQKLQAGISADGARFSASSPAVKLFDECYAECLHAVVTLNRRRDAGLDAVPSLSNDEALTFNALVYSLKSLIGNIERASERLDELLSMNTPVDLGTVAFV